MSTSISINFHVHIHSHIQDIGTHHQLGISRVVGLRSGDYTHNAYTLQFWHNLITIWLLMSLYEYKSQAMNNHICGQYQYIYLRTSIRKMSTEATRSSHPYLYWIFKHFQVTLEIIIIRKSNLMSRQVPTIFQYNHKWITIPMIITTITIVNPCWVRNIGISIEIVANDHVCRTYQIFIHINIVNIGFNSINHPS